MKTKPTTGEKYDRILEAAVRVFAKKGVHQATISQIAREAGVADGTIYLYFKNKDDILVQFCSFKTRIIFEGFRESVNRADGAIEQLRSLIRRHLSEFQKDRNMAIVYQTVIHQRNPLVEDILRENSKNYLDIISGILTRGQSEGVIRGDLNVGMARRFILGAVESTISTWLRSRRHFELKDVTDALVELFVRGVGVHKGPRIRTFGNAYQQNRECLCSS